MVWYIPDIILEAARELRKNMTDAESKLWMEIRQGKLWIKFLRQKPLFVYEEQEWFPRYVIPDFCCLAKKIVIEIDGSIHEDQEVYSLDREKTKCLQARWYVVLRFTNNDVMNDIDHVLHSIVASFP
jgi:leucyl-tRNA synthetase